MKIIHGWERFGENNNDTGLKGYIEGAWLTKYNNTYYMQYAAPGTEFNVYADGVYISSSPLGPYRYAPNNPISYKPGGFMNGAGHGSTVIGPKINIGILHQWLYQSILIGKDVYVCFQLILIKMD